MKRLALSLLFVALVAITVGAFLFGPTVLEMHRVERHARAVRNPPNTSEIAAACVQLLQTTDESRFILDGDSDAIPLVLRAMHPTYVAVDGSHGQGRVLVEFGGGFFHYGYELMSLTPPAHGWSLDYCGEYEEDRTPLVTISQ